MDALRVLRRAERSAVTLFAHVMDDGLFRRLGYATIELYGTQGLGLSVAKTRQFVRLAAALERLPATRAALDGGELSWTKARTIAAVATSRTEERWVAEAAVATSRELEVKVAQARKRNRRERDRLRRARGQAAMVLDTPKAAASVETPVTVSLTLTPVEAARFEGLMETLRKRGRRQSRAALVLEGLDALVASDGPRGAAASPYQVIAYTCNTCNTTTVAGRPVAPAAVAAMQCDSVRSSQDPAEPNRSTIPPSIRRAVLARDHHRCTTPGCGTTRFLEVHHITPRVRGGTNEPDNLATLCSACHRHAHEATRCSPPTREAVP